MSKRIWHPVWLLVGAVVFIGSGVLLHPQGRMIGHPINEGGTHLWVQWLLYRSFSDPSSSLFRHAGVILGQETRVYPVDFTSHLLELPITALFGPVVAYNLGALALLLFAGVATGCLAREAGVGRPTATFAGLFLLFHPAVLGYLSDGRIESLTIGWAVLVVLAWYRLLKGPALRRALELAVALAALAASSPNLFFALGVTLPWPTLVVLVRQPRSLVRPLAVAGIAGALLTAPIVLLMMKVEQSPTGRMQHRFAMPRQKVLEVAPPSRLTPERCPECRAWEDVAVMDAGPAVSPGFSLSGLPEGIWQRRASTGLQVPHLNPGARRSIGGLEVGLLLLALALAPRRSLPWLVGAMMFYLLGVGLGPVHGPPIPIPGSDSSLILRSAPLLARLPMGAHFHNFGLFTELSVVLLAVGGALGVEAASSRLPGRVGAGLPWALAALWIGAVQGWGVLPAPVRVTDVTPPPPVLELARQPGRGGVFLLNHSTELDRYLQILHEKPILTAWNPPPGAPFLVSPVAVRLVAALRRTPCPTGGAADWPQALRTSGIEWLLMLPELTPPDRREALEGCLDHLFGEPFSASEEARLYRVARDGGGGEGVPPATRGTGEGTAPAAMEPGAPAPPEGGPQEMRLH